MSTSCARCGGGGCLLEIGVRSVIKMYVVCFCVVIGVWGVGSCPVPVLVRYGTLVVGRNVTCGAFCCGNVAGGAVPVPYRYCIVRSGEVIIDWCCSVLRVVSVYLRHEGAVGVCLGVVVVGFMFWCDVTALCAPL